MARTNYIVLIVAIIALPFVENAPSSKVNELHTRLVFASAEDNMNKNSQKISTRTEMDDERQIWASAVKSDDLVEDESYYNRPLALPKTVVKNENQASNKVYAAELRPNAAPKPTVCDIAVLVCCKNRSNFKECFKSQGCPNVTEDLFPNLCSGESINRIIENFGKYYKGFGK